MPQEIVAFQGEHRFLSNFFESPFQWKAVLAPTLEHHFQAAKSENPTQIAWVYSAKTPYLAKRRGRQISLRSDWDDMKFGLMLDLVRQKFRDPVLRDLLLATADANLIEGNTWKDTYWGVCNGVGENNLGKILMQVRSELKDLSWSFLT